jgi:uncharacterized protein YdhG (YjbR/CyaY superfamily)
MAKIQFQSVDEYIRSQPHAVQGPLSRVRSAIRSAVPEADELISYNMPTYKLRGASLLHFAIWKTHYSLYAASESIVEEFKTDLRGYTIDKGTIRFSLSEPVPERLIERIAKFRATEAEKQT